MGNCRESSAISPRSPIQRCIVLIDIPTQLHALVLVAPLSIASSMSVTIFSRSERGVNLPRLVPRGH